MPLYSGNVNVIGVKILQVPGAALTTAVGINNHGQVVGHYTDANGRHHGFIFHDGAYSQPIDYPGKAETYLLGINDHSQMVGNADNDCFLYQNGTFSPLMRYPKSGLTSAHDINNFSEIVGIYQDAEANNHGFIYNAGNWHTLAWPGAKSSFASGINDGGQISGGFGDPSGTYGFVYLEKPGVYSSILKYPGTTVTYPYGIDNRGRITGHFIDKAGLDQAFIWFAEGAHQVSIPGAKTISVIGINDRGQIVGNFNDGKALHAYLGVIVA